MLGGELAQRLLGDGEHAAGAARAVVQQVSAGFNPVSDRQKQQLGHQLHHVARREVFSSLFVVFFIEAADQFFEYGAHAVVVERGQFDAALVVAGIEYR